MARFTEFQNIITDGTIVVVVAVLHGFVVNKTVFKNLVDFYSIYRIIHQLIK